MNNTCKLLILNAYGNSIVAWASRSYRDLGSVRESQFNQPHPTAPGFHVWDGVAKETTAGDVELEGAWHLATESEIHRFVSATAEPDWANGGGDE